MLRFVRGVLEVEANAVSDNPIVPRRRRGALGRELPRPAGRGRARCAAAALVPLASIAERRLYRLLDPTRNNGLPAFLVAESGLNRVMLVQYTAASFVSECKTLRIPPRSIRSVRARGRRTT